MNRTAIRGILTAIIVVNMSCYLCAIVVWGLSPDRNAPQPTNTPSVQPTNTPINVFDATNTPINVFDSTNTPLFNPTFTPIQFPTSFVPTSFVPTSFIPTFTPLPTTTPTPLPTDTPAPTLTSLPTDPPIILEPPTDTPAP